MDYTTDYKMPFGFTNSFSTTVSRGWENEIITISQTAERIRVFNGKGYDNTVEILDTEGCVIRTKRMTDKNKKLYLKICDMFANDELEKYD